MKNIFKGTAHFMKLMKPREVRILALAVFFLFGTIGPLTMLMRPNIFPGTWFQFLLVTTLSGMFSACIILLMVKPLRLVIALVIIQAAMFSTKQIEEFIVGAPPSQRIIVSDHFIKFSQNELDTIETKRTVFGVTAISFIAIGYTLFILVITSENKRRARLEAEFAIAQSIQNSLLPTSVCKTDWCEIAGATSPATEVAGDYFDVLQLSENEIVVAVADVSGHGVGAGIISAMTKSALRAELQHSSQPSSVLQHLNTSVFQVTDKKMFVTFAYILLNKQTHTAHLATAGHPPLLLHKSDNSIQEIRTPNLALGMQEHTTFNDTLVHFERGDALYLFTDGITEATNTQKEQFSLDKLRELLQDVQRPSAEKLSASVVASVRSFTETNGLPDDATMVVVRITS